MAEEKRKGRQTPTQSVILPYKNTLGADALRLYRSAGRKPRPWQKAMIKDILAIDKQKLFVHSKYGYEIPRRNGKGEVLVIRELYGLIDGERILHTAHRVTTSHSAWERLCDILDSAGIPYSSYKAYGLESIKLDEGGIINFRTRSAKGGLGEGYDLLVIDEAQEYTDDQASALKYVVTDSKRPQTLFCGTPPTAVSAGTVFSHLRDAAMSGSAENTGWAEWSVDKMTPQDDREAWYETNPSLGYGLTERNIADEIGTDEIDFNIQRLGLWLKYNQKSAISAGIWGALKCDALPALTGKLHVGIKFAHDGKTVSMTIAVKTADGRIFVEAIDDRPISGGYQWMLSFLAKAETKAVVIDGASGQQAMMDAMKDMKLKAPVIPKPGDIIAAGAGFEQSLYQQNICHMGQFSLAQSVTNCSHRPIGSNGGFGYKSIISEVDVSLLEAVVLAHWSCSHEKEEKKQKVGY